MNPPSEMLAGITLPGDWYVDSIIVPPPNATGGFFSTGYRVVRKADGREGFLKAIDFTGALNSPSPIDRLKELLDAYVFEREICLRCRDSGISRVVHAIDHGTFTPQISGIPAFFSRFCDVHYLIFERADCDIRIFLDQQASLDTAFVLRTLHSTAAGLQQLHTAAIAHQDLKPSNVVVFTSDQSSKLADLGRAWCRDIPAPHDSFQIAGDRGYAPPELLFNATTDEQTKRFGYDMYLLGSLIMFMFTKVQCSAMLFSRMPPGCHPNNPVVTYADALPYLQTAFALALKDFERCAPEPVRAELSAVVEQLCDPDYRRRGHPANLHQNRFCLSRYVSKLDLLRYRAETKLRTGN